MNQSRLKVDISAPHKRSEGALIALPPIRHAEKKQDYTWYFISVSIVFLGILIWAFFILGKGKKSKKQRRPKTKKKYGRWKNIPY